MGKILGILGERVGLVDKYLLFAREVRGLNPDAGIKLFLLYFFSKFNFVIFISFIVSDNRGPICLGMTNVNRKHHLPCGIKMVDLVV